MAGEMVMAACLFALLLVVPGLDGSYRSAPGQENVFPHALTNVHSLEERGQFKASQEYNEHHHVAQYHQSEVAQPHHPHQLYRPVQSEQQQHHFQPHQQYLVQSTYNVGSHQEHPIAQSHPQQSKQRHTALPYNNQRLHVKVDHAAASHGFAHPIDPAAQHLRQQLAQEPKKDYRALIPKSIAPKLNPLHHSFHQKRNFVPLHHITRQVPLPAAKPIQPQHHSSGQSQPVQAALAAPPPKHISG
ncbi:histidine-rich glycoprotein-like [Anopheles marshallii]|uniref:histidine-rich glycoprotein-like n=1 Tax=Anopheles marshallii TaxID=1521116 RepID=UPI00237AA947|nr:histidine-rich glycoprotein-like [Anopheles marshallii]